MYIYIHIYSSVIKALCWENHCPSGGLSFTNTAPISGRSSMSEPHPSPTNADLVNLNFDPAFIYNPRLLLSYVSVAFHFRGIAPDPKAHRPLLFCEYHEGLPPSIEPAQIPPPPPRAIFQPKSWHPSPFDPVILRYTVSSSPLYPENRLCLILNNHKSIAGDYMKSL